MRERQFIAVYIMASRRGGAIYVGVTSTLVFRVRQHRDGALPGFTRRYGCRRLVWFEKHASIAAAIRREKLIKHYVRAWKTNLIERDNPDWDDLYPDLLKACGLSDAYPDTPAAGPAPIDISTLHDGEGRPAPLPSSPHPSSSGLSRGPAGRAT